MPTVLPGGQHQPVIALAGRKVLTDQHALDAEVEPALLRQVLRPGDEAVAVPAINTEGRALFEAVSGQGLYGIRARQRTSPYLPGVRSRLWRSVAVGGWAEPSAAGVTTGARGDADEGRDAMVEVFGPQPRSERVLALIRRLPLEFDED